MGILEPMHLVVILGIALLVFGPKKLPELGKGLGESIRGFKSALTGSTLTGSERDPADGARPPAGEEPKNGIS
jgi:sec-independent protein translocase protein TatA